MNEPDKLPLLQRSMRMLVEQLDERDRIAMVVYAGASGLVLPSISCDSKAVILNALDRLEAGGSTNGGAGIELAYEIANQNKISEGSNRVILCTDGDFNVGVTDRSALVRLIEEKRKTGVFLSVLGFGTGNVKDSTMETLADKGNGNYSYIDSLAEARKVLVSEMGGTLFTVAKDVKIQVEFNPTRVQAWRLIGYENRILAHEDFNDDKKDAGEIGAGHTVTALYEIVPVGVTFAERVDPLKYQQNPWSSSTGAYSDELMTLKLRYKAPDGDTSLLLSTPVKDTNAHWGEASEDFRFASSVAAFGMVLRKSANVGTFTLQDVLNVAVTAVGDDASGYRREFVELVRNAQSLNGEKPRVR
jgi:Ca-activated chloride channel family protein